MADPRRCLVFVDRDGAINREVNHLSDPDQLELLPGAVEGLRKLQAAGFPIVVVTNQAQIGRGLIDEPQLERIHDRLRVMLRSEGIEIDGWYWCPHRPEDECDCRKPRPGMLHRAIAERGGTLEGCWMIGDKLSDLQAGKAAGASGILVATGYGRRHRELPESADCVDHFVSTLCEAAGIILHEAATLGDKSSTE